MGSQPIHEITDLKSAPGELSFEARLDGVPTRVWMRTDAPLTPTADAALAATLMPAMRHGGTLRMAEPVSPRMLRGLREYEAIQRAWSLDWFFGAPLQEVAVEAPVREPTLADPRGRVAAFFSGGVDSWATVLGNPDLTDLIFVRGFDLAWEGPHARFADEVEERLRGAAAEKGLSLHVVTTNLRELSDPRIGWDAFFGAATAAAALLLAPLFDRVLIASDLDYELQDRYGTSWLIDHLWSPEGTEIADDGGRLRRIERLRRIAEDPVAGRTLRVCWENPGGAYNCGRCRKCQMTLIALEAIGAREQVTSFPAEAAPDRDLVGDVQLTNPLLLSLWEDLLDAAREAGRLDLEEIVAPVVVRGRAAMRLPRSYRRRSRPGPLPVAAADARQLHPSGTGGSKLFATPETAAVVAEAGAVALLVGGYDGSGNFGDILMLDAALELLEPLEPGLLALPILERRFAHHHRRELATEMIRPPRHQLYFDPEGEADDELVPVSFSPELRSAVSYFYGGGYLNGLWGDRKLAMMRAAEGLIAAAAPAELRRIGSGLQADPAWLSSLSHEDTSLLRSFELLGARDARSGQALEELGCPRVPESGDDALAILGELPIARPPGDEELQINLHCTDNDWVTDDEERLVEFYADLVAELGSHAGRPVVAQPLVAYRDARVDETPAGERLGEVLEQRGIEARTPLVLRPSSLGRTAAEMGRASLTVASSYHVALTSLMLGLPTVTIRDNPYYEQKAAGLLDAFGLPPEFATRSDGDPVALAGRVAAAVLEPEAATALRRQLSVDASSQRLRRAAVEAELLERIAGAGGAKEDPAAAAQAGAERRARAAEQRRLAAEQRAAAAEGRAELAEQGVAHLQGQLAALLGSSSWRLTAPLRRLGARLRRSPQ